MRDDGAGRDYRGRATSNRRGAAEAARLGVQAIEQEAVDRAMKMGK